MVNTILLSIILGVMVFGLVLRLIPRRGMAQSNIIQLDQYTTDAYLNMLQQMVKNYVIYRIEAMIGENFSFSASINDNISNDDLNKINEEVQVEVVQDMCPQMKEYLFYAFGEEFIRKYIRTYTVSLIINYTRLSIDDIIYTKDKK